ncbi:hypothetical protein M378DRAFT_170675 [Amanita muscaria Koide BX008]|uniref:Uncharacterized protein n=1 Tax=Amanita muscaria (strain Koide BX008) TaxID=946122 RepID=A0A0C2WAX7_AMAMK|nr:hypothetical protein M378DRAFT_170675 [Amanita muscaria Koide BX008]
MPRRRDKQPHILYENDEDRIQELPYNPIYPIPVSPFNVISRFCPAILRYYSFTRNSATYRFTSPLFDF